MSQCKHCKYDNMSYILINITLKITINKFFLLGFLPVIVKKFKGHFCFELSAPFGSSGQWLYWYNSLKILVVLLQILLRFIPLNKSHTHKSCCNKSLPALSAGDAAEK